MLFKEMVDKFDNPYLSYILDNSPFNINTSKVIEDRITFDHSMPVRVRATGLFSTDLTKRDDVLLAFLSLLLLLIIEGIVNTILLRTWKGRISNFGFTVKYIIELFREYNFIRVFTGRDVRDDADRPRKKPNFVLVTFAIFILLVTLGLEVGVLFLTDPVLREVTNEVATFRIQQPIPPNYDGVRFQYRASLNRPCSAISLLQVVASRTSINSCVSTTLIGSSVELFKEAEGDVTMTIVSELHDYGAEHRVTIGNLSADYSTRVFFNLEDAEPRLMKRSTLVLPEMEMMDIVHKQYVAFLFSIYAKDMKDNTMNIDRLNALEFNFDNSTGRMIDIIRVGDKTERAQSMKYTTTVTGVIPRGDAALRVAQKAFRGAFAIILDDADMTDLFIQRGVQSVQAITWSETARVINWLSLLILLGAATIVLLILRLFLKPVTTAEIAGVIVKDHVGADLFRSPVQLDADEQRAFSLRRRRPQGPLTDGAEPLQAFSTLAYSGVDDF